MSYPTVPDLTPDQIESETNTLRKQAMRTLNKDFTFPVPIEEIAETHLGLHYEFDDLGTRLGVPDVLGALYVGERKMVIDSKLNPDEGGNEGRYRFTVAHEVAHWWLHRPYLESSAASRAKHEALKPAIICRSSRSKEPIERQADAFAASLLLPRDVILENWHALHGEEKLRIENARKWIGFSVHLNYLKKLDDDGMIETALKVYAKVFGVSPPAMRIRLEALGLVIRDSSSAGSSAG